MIKIKKAPDKGIPVETYIDKEGKEFVVLTDPRTNVSEVKYIRDLIIEAFGNADEYDKLIKERNDDLLTR